MAEPAYRTISEVAAMVGVPHHVLRFWETKFPTIAPLKRGGNRRYYRPADVAAAQTVARLLHHEGYTIKGAQKLLEGLAATPAPSVAPAASPSAAPTPPAGRRLAAEADLPWVALAAIRDDLAAALANAR